MAGVPAAATGALYALTARGEVLKIDLPAGSITRLALPDEVARDAPGSLAVLPEGLVVYEQYGTRAAALPFDTPLSPRLVAARIEATVVDRVVATPQPATQPPTHMFIDGRGEIVATEVRDPERHKDYEALAVVGNSEISRGPESHLVEQIDLTTRAVTPVGAGVLIAASHDHVALTACLSASRCVVASGPLSDPYLNRVEFGHPVPRGVLSADGRNLAFVRSKLNGPEEVWVLDLTNGDSHMVHAAPDVPPLVGFTADGGHLVSIGTNPGTLNVIIVSDAHSLVIDLGERLRAIGIRPTL